ncbi:MAG: hypothetical protein K2X10_08685 [Hyphomicrobiales bacterium]|nr:hypothetical protein [Hyphomicrobiales bacterium]
MSCNFFGVLLGACQIASSPPPQLRPLPPRAAVLYVDGRRQKATGKVDTRLPLCDYDTSPFERIVRDRPAQDFIDERAGGPANYNGRSCVLPVYRDPRF